MAAPLARPTDNLGAISLIVASMALFTLEDLSIKWLTATLPEGQIMVMFAALGVALFAVLALAQRRAIFAARNWRPLPLVRAALEGVGAAAFLVAVARADLTLITAIFMVMPIVATMGAALFLGEQVGLVRWSAVAVGFVGVLIILRPGLGAVEPAALWVLVSVGAIAARDLLTRVMDTEVPPPVVSAQAYLASLAAGAMMLAGTEAPTRLPTPSEAALVVAGVSVGALGYLAIVTAMRRGEPSVVAPLRYTRLVFTLLAGVVVLGERPDAATLIGSALVVGAGLVIALRERARARRALKSATPPLF